MLQVALAVIVAVAAGLLVRTFAHLSSVPLGFDADRVIVVPVETARAAGAVDRLAFVQRLTDAVAAAPGVQHAAASMWTPLSGAGAVLGLRPPDTPKGGDEINVVANFVTPGWFAVYGTSIRQGRDFSASDTATAPRVVVVNRAFVRRFLRNAPAIGQPIADGPVIVGVADDAVLRSSQRIPGVESLALREPVPPTIYAPLAQMGGWDRPPATRFRVSARPSTGDPLALSPAIGAALSAVDPNLEFTMRPLAADVGASLSQERAMAAIAASFAALSLLLAVAWSLRHHGVFGQPAPARNRPSIGRRRHAPGRPQAHRGARASTHRAGHRAWRRGRGAFWRARWPGCSSAWPRSIPSASSRFPRSWRRSDCCRSSSRRGGPRESIRSGSCAPSRTVSAHPPARQCDMLFDHIWPGLSTT